MRRKLLSFSLIFVLLFCCNTDVTALGEKDELSKNVAEPRFSTELVGDVTEIIEILSVTVLPHTKSGNVAYNLSDSNSTNDDLGALINIFVKNKSGHDIYPQVTFSGKSACEYLDMYPQKMSWASVPDTRADRKYDRELSGEFEYFTPLTTHIPSGAVDCYCINVTDGSLIRDGLSCEISADGKTGSMTLYADEPSVSIERIRWSSSYNDKCYPDTMQYCIMNNSPSDVTVNNVKIYDGTQSYYLHYWKELSGNSFTAQTLNVESGKIRFGKVGFEFPLQFREYIAEFNITNGTRTYSLLYKFRPLIYDFDISTGWASLDVEKESYIKAISSMHVNTVIGAYKSSYYLRDEEFRKRYPIKIFGYVEDAHVSDKMTVENSVVTIYDIDDIHAALPFGEPQLNDGKGKYQPMRVYNKLMMYRNSPYATNITLTHEPAFYRFAGLSDFCHYDAYRVTAPFSDAWYTYFGYARKNKYALYWGAPLETQGDYMRTLASLNRPNPVAAWTQGANTWDVFPRFTSDVEYMTSPNPYELRVQAYLNVANGASSLYWFNINGEDLLYYKESAREMMYVNREFTVLGDLLSCQIPFRYERQNNVDLNVNIGADYAVLFATDLNYTVFDAQYRYLECDEERTLSFPIPDYLENCTELVKVTKDGVSLCKGAISDGKLTVCDKTYMTSLYVLGYDGLFENLKRNYEQTIEKECFDIFENEACYDELQSEYGYTDEAPFTPENAKRNSLLRLFIPLVRVLERIIYVLAALLYVPYEIIKKIV